LIERNKGGNTDFMLPNGANVCQFDGERDQALSSSAMVVIAGGGLVGSALALALNRARIPTTLIETPHIPRSDDTAWDSRVYAISPGSMRFLEECGAILDYDRAGTIDEMRVYGDDGTSRLTFTAYDAGVPALAATMENRALQQSLAFALTQSGVESLASQCGSLEWNSSTIKLHLANGMEISAELVVGADGAESWVRSQAGIPSYAESYSQTAVVANFECDKPHHNVAYQWFRRDGVLAYLPLPARLISIVFSTWNDRALELTAMSPQEFCDAVAEAGNHMLGDLKLLTAPRTFPLARMEVEELIGPRVALVGDAAHVVHPLAGQGLNIGFRDARELARILSERGQCSCGDRIVLRRYERSRSEDIASMRFVTDSLQKLFNNEIGWLASLRNLGLKLTDSLQPLKTALIRQAIA
jgi:ubiquinone biosynthesis UbiH/UbiF/VisC/COQ6 family hydroxylase